MTTLIEIARRYGVDPRRARRHARKRCTWHTLHDRWLVDKDSRRYRELDQLVRALAAD